jgi:hypothetical protein
MTVWRRLHKMLLAEAHLAGGLVEFHVHQERGGRVRLIAKIAGGGQIESPSDFNSVRNVEDYILRRWGVVIRGAEAMASDRRSGIGSRPAVEFHREPSRFELWWLGVLRSAGFDGTPDAVLGRDAGQALPLQLRGSRVRIGLEPGA